MNHRITRLLMQVVFGTWALSTCTLVQGQTANVPFASPVLTFLGQNGQPLANGKVYTFSAGTTSPLPTYPSANAVSPNVNPNPITLNAGGSFQIWLGSSCYKFVVYNSANVLQWSADQICATNLSSVATITSNNCSSSLIATSGFIRMCNGDILNWRTISNTANIGFAQLGVATAATGNLADVLQYGSSSTGAFMSQRFMDASGAPAQSGVVATGNNVCAVASRNAAGTADVCNIEVNNLNQLVLGGSAGIVYQGATPAPGNVKLASLGTGSDCGAKINAQCTALSGPGEVWIDQACGTAWTTAVSCSASQGLRFIQGGKYSSTACPAVTLPQGGYLVGVPLSSWANASPCDGTIGVCLQQAASTNCGDFVLGNGASAQVRDMVIDGNAANNTTGGVGIKVNLASRFRLDHAIVQNWPTHGVWFHSTGLSNQSCCWEVLSSFIGFNLGDGIFSDNTADGSIGGKSEIETNGLTAQVNTNGSGVATYASGTHWSSDSSLVNTTVKINGILCQVSALTSTTITTANCQSSVNSLSNVTIYFGGGIELLDSPTARFVWNDIGGNFAFGLGAFGSGSGLSSSKGFLAFNQFGNGYTHDFECQGYGLATATLTGCWGWIVQGNWSIGKNPNAQASTWDVIFVRDSQQNSISGNNGQSNSSVPFSRYLVNITESVAGRDVSENVIGNIAAGPAADWAAPANTNLSSNSNGFNCNTQNQCSSVGFSHNQNTNNNGVVTNETAAFSAVAPGTSPAVFNYNTGTTQRPFIVTRLTANSASANLAGCTTAQIVTFTCQGGSQTLTTGNGANTWDSGGIDLNCNAGAWTLGISTQASGCSTAPNNVGMNVMIQPNR